MESANLPSFLSISIDFVFRVVETKNSKQMTEGDNNSQSIKVLDDLVFLNSVPSLRQCSLDLKARRRNPSKRPQLRFSSQFNNLMFLLTDNHLM